MEKKWEEGREENAGKEGKGGNGLGWAGKGGQGTGGNRGKGLCFQLRDHDLFQAREWYIFLLISPML